MARKKNVKKYYDLNPILETNAQYCMVIGERSNGKTFAGLEYILNDYWKNGNEGAIVRRWIDDFRRKRGASLFNGLADAGRIEEITNGKWEFAWYWNSAWYLARYNEAGEREREDNPFCYAFAISAQEHDKSTSYPRIKTVLFDEFLTRSNYLPDEFVLFMNTLSTIIRGNDDVKIFMFGNTVNKYSPYFEEMGLTNVKSQRKGTIDVYNYGDSNLKVAVEYCAEKDKSINKSDVYFAFDNPRLNMITGHGSSWEIDIYPHCPCKYNPSDILFTYFIIFDRETLQCEIIQKEDLLFTFIHRKTTDLKDTKNDLIFTTDWNVRPNYRRNILYPIDNLGKRIKSFFQMDKVFYQSNEVGEIVNNYAMWCKTN